MTPPTVPAEATLQQLVDEHILGAGRRCFLVNRDGHPAGLITVHRIKEIDRAKWSATTTSDVMLPLNQLKSLKPETELWNALQLMDRDGVNQLPVMSDGEVAGMLSREDVITFLRTVQELGT